MRRYRVWVFIVCYLVAGVFVWINRSILAQYHPTALRLGITVATQDDASYLATAENFLYGKGWRSNAHGSAAYVTRSPGYGIFYLALRSVFSEQSALLGLVMIQIALFAFAVSLIPSIARLLGLPRYLRLILTTVVALLPTFFGFLGYTLTEGVTPSLTLIFFYLFIRHYQGRQGFLGPAALLALLILIRPSLLVFAFSFVSLLFIYPGSSRFFRLFRSVGVALFPMTVWIIYTSKLIGGFSGLHPIYQPDAAGLYRPVHSHIWDFHKMWGQSGFNFHKVIYNLYENDNMELSVEFAVQSLDSSVLNVIDKQDLQRAYFQYATILAEQKKSEELGHYISTESLEEQRLTARFDSFRKSYVSAYPIKSLLCVPFKAYLSLGLHSNLSMFVFQNPWRGIFLVELLRVSSFLLHALIFLFFPIGLLYVLYLQVLKRQSLSMILGIFAPISIYISYLCLVQRGVEERYTAPILIPMLLLDCWVVYHFWKRNIGLSKTSKVRCGATL